MTNTENQGSRGLLRIATSGSVDDGKSTLIGRLLYDSKSILEDNLESVVDVSNRKGYDYVNLALLTDGLRAEREQGITIDVAYRFFATGAAATLTAEDLLDASSKPKDGRKFIIADTPGHIQYTRNTVTGASTADLAIVLVDARHGINEQTKRHSYISSLLRIPNIVVAVNKMDLVDWSEERFSEIEEEFRAWSSQLDIQSLKFIPLSALQGDNVVEPSENMPWYKGETLLAYLENVDVTPSKSLSAFRYPVQWVIRPMNDDYHDYRGYAGQIANGVVHVGDEIVVFPSKKSSRIKAIETFDSELEEAFAPMSVTLQLEDDVDISRGDTIVSKDEALPHLTRKFSAVLSWMSEEALSERTRLVLKHTTSESLAIIESIDDLVNINDLSHQEKPGSLKLNEIGRVQIKTASPIIADRYAENRTTGSFILIDEASNNTVAAGMIEEIIEEL